MCHILLILLVFLLSNTFIKSDLLELDDGELLDDALAQYDVLFLFLGK